MDQHTASSAVRQLAPSRPLIIERRIMSNRHAYAFVSAHSDADERRVTMHLPPADRPLTERERKGVLAAFGKFVV